MTAILLAAVVAGCSDSGTPPPSSVRHVAEVRTTGPSPRAVAMRYFLRTVAGRPTRRLAAPRTPADRRSLRALDRWLGSIPAHDVDAVAVPLTSDPAGSASVLVTMRGRLGRGPRNATVSFGGRRMLLRRGAGGWRVVADESSRAGSGVAADGLSVIRRARYVPGPNALVVNAAGAPQTDVARVQIGAASFSTLVARYAPPRFDRTPVVFLLRDWRQAEAITGVTFPHEAVGAEYRGLVFLDEPSWSRADEVGGQGVVVHELTHVASARLVRGTPLSLIEGLATYEEQEYDRRAGAPRSRDQLAAAYRSGYPTAVRWSWAIHNTWQLHASDAIRLAYEDGAAVVGAVVSAHGVEGLRRLAAEFRREGGGWFSAERLRQVFRRALGERLADVIARAHAQTYARVAAEG
ncbi:MAG TPA: hypothetical protein VH459_11085 [Gaiellales bacterium]